MFKMKAVKVMKNGCIEFSDFEEPYPPDNSWAKIKVISAGLCGSDIQKFLLTEELLHYSGTEILGHEISGDVIDQGTTNVSSGTRVMVMPLIPCYECDECSSQNQNLCHNLKSIGKHLPG